MRTTGRAVAGLLVALVGVLLVGASTPSAQGQATYLYTLANFGGPLKIDGVRVSVDQETDEVYVIYQNIIHIFNPSGMEVFSFGDDLDLGQILDAVADTNGDILLLSYKDSHSIVTRCNYRGVPKKPIEFTKAPQAWTLDANRMMLRNGRLYLANLATSRVTITNVNGEFQSQIDFLSLLQADERRDGVEMFGFTVDQDGSVFVTMPTLFRAFKRTADGALMSFGKPGSGPGQFGVVAGITTDSHGNVFVADKIKCVVMVFDKAFKFITEFGYRGPKAENLIVPDDIAADRRGRLYVAQWRRRGVSVFSLALQ